MASPGRMARWEEKEELGDLNNRLAVYMARMREQKDTIERLSKEITVLKASHTRTLDQMRLDYDTELQLARKGLDETAKEKALFQMEATRQSQRANEAETELSVCQTESARLRKELEGMMHQLSSAQGEAATARKATFEAQQSLAAMSDARDTYKRLYEEEQAKCEAEALEKVQKENELLSAQEELTFRQQTHTTRVTELNSEIDMLRAKVLDIETSLKRKYDSAMIEALNQFRVRYETAAEAFRQELHEHYESQLLGIIDEREAAKQQSIKARADLNEIRGAHDQALSALSSAEKQLGVVEGRNKALEFQLTNLKLHYEEDFKAKDVLVIKLQDSCKDKDAAYKELMDVRIALDAEIAAYRKLLEVEENRLGIVISPAAAEPRHARKRPHEDSAGANGQDEQDAKRPRISYNDASTTMEAITDTPGAVHIEELNMDGLFVTLTNLTEEEISMHKWTLNTRGPNDEGSTFTFPKKFALGAKASVLVWTSASPSTENLPTDLVWKDLERLSTVAQSVLTLSTNKGEVVSSCCLQLKEGEIYNPASDPSKADQCVVM